MRASNALDFYCGHSCRAAPARAQDAQTGLDRFRLGMSMDEARAVLPDAEWTREVIPDSGGAVALMTRVPVLIGSTSFAPALEFRGGALAVVRYGRPVRTEDSRDCMTATLQIVRSLEAGGLFDGAHSRTEPDSAPMVIQTGAGSVLRAYISSDGMGSTYANRRGEVYAEVRSRFDSQARTPCLLTVRLSADPNPPRLRRSILPRMMNSQRRRILKRAPFGSNNQALPTLRATIRPRRSGVVSPGM